jgi:lipopolysaccharide/colanic/teichoic acid biosynthesis glycosyltransferase
VRKVNLLIKRFVDILGSFIGIIILSPLFILVAICIKVTSEGPVFFKQKRLGKDGKVFDIIKFRTMIVNAEKIGDGLTVKSEDDSRITKVGKLLRKTSLDELPQLINVLKGDMSLVGPRPPATYFPYDGYENYPEWAKRRFDMRPGMTGLAQITVRNSVVWDKRIVIDNIYIDEFNILLDTKILLLTVARIIKPQSIYYSTPVAREVKAKDLNI